MTAEKEYTCVFLNVILPRDRRLSGLQAHQIQQAGDQAHRDRDANWATSTLDKLRGSLAGCDEYLTKPVDENRLLEVIAKFLPAASSAAV